MSVPTWVLMVVSIVLLYVGYTWRKGGDRAIAEAPAKAVEGDVCIGVGANLFVAALTRWV